ncbi:MAG: O-antigen ligase family protein [Bacteroidales bacterium]|nr:O-antigen ligase family protein [Bacteroidales bacterium]
MRNFIFITLLFFPEVFFSLAAIFGRDYSGAEHSDIYIYSTVATVLLSLFFVFGESTYKKVAPISRANILFYSIPFLAIVFYLIESPLNANGKQFFRLFFAFSASSIYVGTYMAANNYLIKIAKWIDVVFIVIMVGLISSLPRMVNLNEIVVGGLIYQQISYNAAFAFSLGLYSLLFGNSYQRYKLFKSRFYKIMTSVSLFFIVLIIIISAGRGGSVLLITSTIVILLYRFKNIIGFKKNIRIITSLVILFYIFQFILPQEFIPLTKIGTERLISYFSFGGIDMNDTSGRNIVYSVAWKMFIEQPIFGYGIFKYVSTFNLYIDDVIPYPHNIILEFLLQGGIFYLIFWLLILWKYFLKFKIILKHNSTNGLLIPISLLPITLLLFSGTYLTTGLFWFSLSYVFNYKPSLALRLS